MRKFLPYILIAIVIFIGAGLYVDSLGSASITELMPKKNNSTSGTETKLKSLGQAPEFTGIYKWLNLPAGRQVLKMEELKGKVVLVDFWTYSCINCIRTLPYVTKWYDDYKDEGLVVIGVHTPEFAFEKVTKNVETAIERHKINYPVAQDNDYRTWQAYDNHYWPAKYLIDQNGQIVYTHFGEGDYEETEAVIRQLLQLGANQKTSTNIVENFLTTASRSPEMYFGFAREEHMAQNYQPNITQKFEWLRGLEMNQYQLEGTWVIEPERAILKSDTGRIRLRYKGSSVNMVASNPKGSTLKIFINNQEQKPLTVSDSQLYTLFQEQVNTEHELIIEINGSGFEAFTFTFG